MNPVDTEGIETQGISQWKEIQKLDTYIFKKKKPFDVLHGTAIQSKTISLFLEISFCTSKIHV